MLPIASWEFSLGVYLVVKGFRPAAVARAGIVTTTHDQARPTVHVDGPLPTVWKHYLSAPGTPWRRR